MIKTEVVFKLLRMTKKMGILNDLKGFFKKVDTKDKNEIKKIQEEIGIDFAITVINNMANAEEEFYDIIASLEEKTPDEVRKQDLDITVNAIKDLFKSGAFKSFLSLLSK